MLIASLFIGLLTAYYFGLRAGGIAVAATLGLLLLAAVLPGATLPAYLLVAAGTAGVCVIGPRVSPPAEENTFRRLGKRLFAQARSRMDKRS